MKNSYGSIIDSLCFAGGVGGLCSLSVFLRSTGIVTKGSEVDMFSLIL